MSLLMGSQQQFLSGGGELGARIRARDWHGTSLGDPATWPQSLRSAIGICLNTQFPIAVYWGTDLALLYNDAWSAIPGEKHPWALGRPGREVWPDIWEEIGPLFERVQTSGEGVWQQDQLLPMHRHGYTEECYFNFTFSPIRGEDGRVEGIFNAVVETTFRVIEERRSRHLQDLAARTMTARTIEEVCKQAAIVLEAAAADVPFGLFYLFDETGRATLVAQVGAQLPESLCPASFSRDDAGVIWSSVTETDSGGPRVIDGLAELTESSARGSVWPEPLDQAVVMPLISSQQPHPVGFFIAGVSPRRALDASSRRYFDRITAQLISAISDAHLHETERRRAEALAEIDRAKTAFFSNVSHEFRTPLTLLLGPIEEVLAEDQIPTHTRERMELIRRNALRLQKLVNALLDFSRIEAGRVQATYEAVDLSVLTRDIASTFRSAIERAGLRFQVDCDDLSEPAYVDREMWEKIVLNLLSNAFKFTLDGEIRLLVRAQDQRIYLTVIDTGVGVPPEELPRLFERFHRVENPQARTHEGSGIGLALVQELVRLHGGAIEVESTLGCGSTFRVGIPSGRGHLPAERVREAGPPRSLTATARAFAQEALRWSPAQSDSSQPGELTQARGGDAERRRFASTFGSRIVLADDNADMRAYVAELLSTFYRVEAVADGEQALEAIKRQRPQLILSDVMMPRLDGMGLLATLRRDDSLRGIPIILLSARAGEESRIEGFDAGADDYLVKPFSARELIVRVGAILERQRAQEAFRLRTMQFETLLNQAPLGVFLVDSNLRIRDVNPTARRMFGDVPDLVGREYEETMRLLWSKPLADELVRRLWHTLASGESYVGPERIERRPDRISIEYYEWQIHRIPLPEGQQGVVCYIRDVSADASVRRKLEDADRRKDVFLATLSHELRNPLAPIRNAIDLIGSPKLSAERTSWLRQVIQRQVKHMALLLDDLLDVARITQGKLKLRKQSVLLSDIVDAAIETARPILDKKSHKLEIRLPPQSCYLDADPLRLAQVISNLLTNAAKYTDSGGRVEILAHIERVSLSVSVRDNGIGISSAAIPDLFSLFSQIDSVADRSEGGLGIGLALVKGLVELHGGTVEAHSAGAGRGSVFTVRLPLSPGVHIAKPVEVEDAAPRFDAPAERGAAAVRASVLDQTRSFAML
jgi:PAS domain S-box-containing protein